MKQIQAKILSVSLPTIKGTTILLASYALNFLNDNVRSVSLWTLTMVLTCLGIYDFWLKIRYKHRKERERREEEPNGQE